MTSAQVLTLTNHCADYRHLQTVTDLRNATICFLWHFLNVPPLRNKALHGAFHILIFLAIQGRPLYLHLRTRMLQKWWLVKGWDVPHLHVQHGNH